MSLFPEVDPVFSFSMTVCADTTMLVPGVLLTLGPPVTTFGGVAACKGTALSPTSVDSMVVVVKPKSTVKGKVRMLHVITSRSHNVHRIRR